MSETVELTFSLNLLYFETLQIPDSQSPKRTHVHLGDFVNNKSIKLRRFISIDIQYKILIIKQLHFYTQSNFMAFFLGKHKNLSNFVRKTLYP